MTDAPAERMTRIPEADLSPRQREVHDAIVAGPRGGFGRPWVPMIRSPELCQHVQEMGSYLRYASPLPGPLRELAILIIVRHCGQPYEWKAHGKIALGEGLPAEVITAVGQGRRPSASADQLAVYDFIEALLNTRVVGDKTYQALAGIVGEQGIVDIIGLSGYYLMMSMALNVANPAMAVGEFGPPEA